MELQIPTGRRGARTVVGGEFSTTLWTMFGNAPDGGPRRSTDARAPSEEPREVDLSGFERRRPLPPVTPPAPAPPVAAEKATLRFCMVCRRHFEATRRYCPTDGQPLVPVPPAVPGIGSRLDDRYLVTALLAQGGMAVLFQALDLQTRESLAIKVLRPEFAARSGQVAQFFAEARTLREVTHPHIVQIRDFGRTTDGHVFIALELLRGRSLAALLQHERKLDAVRALRVARQVLLGLHAAHRFDVVHLDIKPANVQLVRGPEGGETVKILDFGLARFLAEPQRRDDLPETAAPADSIEIRGTPAYMSPEQCLGQPVDHRADLYAVGVLLFECLTGRPPFEHANLVELCHLHVTAPVPPLGEFVPELVAFPELGRFLDSLLEKRPENRPRSARAAVEAIDRVLGVSRTDVEGDGERVHATVTTRYVFCHRLQRYRPLDESCDHPDGCGRCLEDRKRAAALMASGPKPTRPEEPALPAPSDADTRCAPVALLALQALLEERNTDGRVTLHELPRAALQPLVGPLGPELQALGGTPIEEHPLYVQLAFGLGPLLVSPAETAHAAAALLFEHAQLLPPHRGRAVRLRAGLAVGQVFIERDQPGTPAWALRGSAPKLALRLVRLAPPGALLADRPAPLPDGPEPRPHQYLRVRGHAEAVPIYLWSCGVTGASPWSVPELRAPLDAVLGSQPTLQVSQPADTLPFSVDDAVVAGHTLPPPRPASLQALAAEAAAGEVPFEDFEHRCQFAFDAGDLQGVADALRHFVRTLPGAAGPAPSAAGHAFLAPWLRRLLDVGEWQAAQRLFDDVVRLLTAGTDDEQRHAALLLPGLLSCPDAVPAPGWARLWRIALRRGSAAERPSEGPSADFMAAAFERLLADLATAHRDPVSRWRVRQFGLVATEAYDDAVPPLLGHFVGYAAAPERRTKLGLALRGLVALGPRPELAWVNDVVRSISAAFPAPVTTDAELAEALAAALTIDFAASVG